MLKIIEVKSEEHFEQLRLAEDTNNDYLYICKHCQLIKLSDNGTIKTFGDMAGADFVTSEGFANLRFYDNKLQYYNTDNSQWTDVQVTSDNYIINLTPQPMQKFIANCNPDTMDIELFIDESDDTIIEGQSLCIIEKVIIRRKKDDYPTDETDGDLVLEINRKDFNQYKNIPYIDVIDDATSGDIYYYKAFPVSTTGIVANLVDNQTSCTIKDYYLFGFTINQNESNPSKMITYIEDNKNYTSAYMDFDADEFNYGDWKDVWFIKNLKPCMLNYNGTIDYELNKEAYSFSKDNVYVGNYITNKSYAGNVMVGIPKTYWKIVDNGDNTANIYISNKKVDNDFHCWSHIDNNGNEIDYCYLGAYTSCYYSSKMRSLSGFNSYTSGKNYAITKQITYAKNNNTTSDSIWGVETFSDIMLINILLLLIGKSTDVQSVFGTGNTSSYTGSTSQAASGILNSGLNNWNGLFYGTNDEISGIKVFGMEHWWGNQERYICGCVLKNGKIKVKMTYGQSDNSTIDGYNTDGEGYIELNDCTTDNLALNSFISKMHFNEFGWFPEETEGSSSTYYSDTYYNQDGGVDNVLLTGGSTSLYENSGIFYTDFWNGYTNVSYDVITRLSCKPLAITE